MAKVITTELQHSGASAANITLDSSKNVTCENNLTVDGNLTVTGTNNVGAGGATGTDYNDNVKVRFGTGNDLEIYHADTDNFLKSNNGHIKIQAPTGKSAYILVNEDEYAAKFNENGKVELYYDDNKKFETTSTGITVTGDVNIDTADKGIKSTAGKIVVHATNGQITLKTDSNDVIMAQATDNSSYSNSILQSYGARNTTNGTWNLAHFYGPGFGGQFKVADSGNCTNTNNSYGSTSDERLKQDIVDAASQWNDIKGLRVRKFRWKAAPTAPLSIGLVAQEAETVSPGLVENTGVEEQDSNGHAQPKFDADGNRETVKTLKYSVLYMKAIKCLQEAQARIETLETKVAALEAG